MIVPNTAQHCSSPRVRRVNTCTQRGNVQPVDRECYVHAGSVPESSRTARTLWLWVVHQERRHPHTHALLVEICLLEQCSAPAAPFSHLDGWAIRNKHTDRHIVENGCLQSQRAAAFTQRVHSSVNDVCFSNQRRQLERVWMDASDGRDHCCTLHSNSRTPSDMALQFR